MTLEMMPGTETVLRVAHEKALVQFPHLTQNRKNQVPHQLQCHLLQVVPGSIPCTLSGLWHCSHYDWQSHLWRIDWGSLFYSLLHLWTITHGTKVVNMTFPDTIVRHLHQVWQRAFSLHHDSDIQGLPCWIFLAKTCWPRNSSLALDLLSRSYFWSAWLTSTSSSMLGLRRSSKVCTCRPKKKGT